MKTEDPPGELRIMVVSPSTPSWSVLLSQKQKCSDHLSTLFFLGGGVSILSKLGFGRKYSKTKHTRFIFLNIFVQDCRRMRVLSCVKYD